MTSVSASSTPNKCSSRSQTLPKANHVSEVPSHDYAFYEWDYSDDLRKCSSSNLQSLENLMSNAMLTSRNPNVELPRSPTNQVHTRLQAFSIFKRQAKSQELFKCTKPIFDENEIRGRERRATTHYVSRPQPCSASTGDEPKNSIKRFLEKFRRKML